MTQDTFLRAHHYGDSLRDPKAVRGWPYRIATHVCLDRLRQRKTLASLDSEEGENSRAPAVSDALLPLDITDWDLHEKFVCSCGSPDCYGEIRGFKYLSPKQRRPLEQFVPEFMKKRIPTTNVSKSD